MPSEVQEKIETRIERMPLRDLKLLELNARYMRHETFATLVANLRRDGELTSVPFAVWDEASGKYLVLSGNHRVMAAIEAGIEEANVQLTDQDLPEQRRVAIQLSHNAITGEDDPATLQQLYDQLEDLDWRDYAGLDDATLELMEQVSVGELKEAELEFSTVALVFLPNELEKVNEVLADARESAIGHDVFLARMSEYDRMLEAIDIAGRSYGMKNIAISLLVVLEVFERHRHELAAGYLDDAGDVKPEREDGRVTNWVPLESIVGTHSVPASSAAVIRKAVDKMRGADEVSEKALWQAFEHWAADYLAGP